jgi:hypothetical protein
MNRDLNRAAIIEGNWPTVIIVLVADARERPARSQPVEPASCRSTANTLAVS